MWCTHSEAAAQRHLEKDLWGVKVWRGEQLQSASLGIIASNGVWKDVATL
jgi:hypothetical protein